MILLVAWLTTLRLAVGVLTFLGVLHLLRDVTRPIITRFIPIQRRMQSGFLKLQNRLTIGTNILLAVVVAFGMDVLFVQVHQAVAPASEELQELRSFQPLPLATPKKAEEIPKNISLQKEDSSIENRPLPDTPTYASIEENDFYLQVGAYEQQQNALRSQARWTNQSSHAVRVAYMAHTYAPYKVVVGAFPNRESASSYGKNLKKSNFPRRYDPQKMQWLQD